MRLQLLVVIGAGALPGVARGVEIAARIEKVETMLGDESLSPYQRVRHQVMKRTLEKQKEELSGGGGKRRARGRGRKGHLDDHWPNQEMCRDNGAVVNGTLVPGTVHDCCANDSDGEPPVCAEGYVPTDSPHSHEDCPNYGCCPEWQAADDGAAHDECMFGVPPMATAPTASPVQMPPQMARAAKSGHASLALLSAAACLLAAWL
eukprot:COSAG04_NODE_6558_length_1304_cov_1.122720_1_plen_205_part_00